MAEDSPRYARPGYAGLIFTHGLGWAVLNVLASGVSPLSLWLLGLSFFLRLAQSMTVGAVVLGDHQMIANLWLLPLRDALRWGFGPPGSPATRSCGAVNGLCLRRKRL